MKDWITLVAIIASIALTLLALRNQEAADRDTSIAQRQEVDRLGETNEIREQRLAKERAVKRFVLEGASLKRRTSSVYFVLAVITAGVGSVPWLVIPALVIESTWILYAMRRVQQQLESLRQRRDILESIWRLALKDLSGPFLFDSQIFGLIDMVYGLRDEDLNRFEQHLRLGDIQASLAINAYKARHNAAVAREQAAADQEQSAAADALSESVVESDTTGADLSN